MLGEDDGDDGEEVVAAETVAAASFMGLLIVEITFPSVSIVLVCSVTIVVDRPSGYPPSAGTTCVASVRAYSRTDMVPKEIDLDDDDDDDGLDLLHIGVDEACCIIGDDGDDAIDSVPL